MISVLTVNYRSSSDLVALAQSLREAKTDEDVELIVTNNSIDDDIQLETNSALPIRVIASKNVGYAAGINLAARHARGDILFMANPDVRVSPGSMKAAADHLRLNTDVGILLPLLRHPSGDVQDSVRRFYTWPVVLYARSPFRALGGHPTFFRRYLYEDLDRSEPCDVDWGLGGAMFIRKPEGPIFDERFFLYFEDVDFCLRTWQSGRRVIYCPDIECVHAHRRMSSMPFSVAGRHHLTSLMRFVAKHRGLPQRP